MHMATQAIPGQTTNHSETTIPALVVASFFNGVTPSLEKLASLSSFCQSQFDYYSAMGVADPLLGPYEALGRAFAETDGFRTKYGALTTDFVATTYAEVFGRAPSDAQAAHFQSQVDYFVGIYMQAGLTAENSALFAKGAVLGQMIGVASLYDAAALDYNGAARAFIDQMDDAGFVPGKPLFDYVEVIPPGPDPLGVSFANGILTLSAADTYNFAVDDAGALTITRAGSTDSMVLPLSGVIAIDNVVIANSAARVDIKAEDVTGLHVIRIGGAGTFNITDVDLSTPPFCDVPNMSMLSFDSTADYGVLPTQLLVNGNVADAFLTMWAGITLDYYAGLPSGSAIHDWVLARLGNDYVRYLEAHDPIDVVAVSASGADPRAQTLHDNLLGRVNDDYVTQRVAAGDGYLDARSPEAMAYGSRPSADGFSNDPSDERAALAWDYSKGINHIAYVSHDSGADVDAAGQFSPGTLWYAYDSGAVSGVSATGFTIGRHEGAGVELGLKVKDVGGMAIAPVSVDADGTAHYAVPAGAAPGGGAVAQWDIDFSALAGLNGRTSETLDTYAFTLRIDTDPTAGVAYRDFTLSGDSATGIFNWGNGAGGVIADHDGPRPGLSQNSLNFGQGFIKAMFDMSPDPGDQPYDLSAGTFDVQLLASKDGVQLVGAHVVVDVA
jgi:hypothetical protein